MKDLCLKQSLGQRVLSLTRIPWAVIGAKGGQFSSGFSPEVCLGNLRALYCVQVLKSLGIFTESYCKDWYPLSYLQIPSQAIEACELRSLGESKIGEGWHKKNKGGARYFGHEIAMQTLFLPDAARLRMEMRKLIGLEHSADSFQTVNPAPVDEVWLAQDQLCTLPQAFTALECEQEKLLFTRHPLHEYGIHFAKGLHYELSGYGLHSFYLADSDTVFLFLHDGEFSTIFFAFLSILSDLEVLAEPPQRYLDFLTESIKSHPYVTLEICSLD